MPSLKLTYIFFTFFISFHLAGYSENFISNSGFEGPDGIEIIPEDWFAGCGVMNTPDTQPGWWNVENTPHGGDSYINLLYKEDGTMESVYQELKVPLTKGSCFLIEIYLAQACQDSLDGLYPYGLNNPGNLIIRGSDIYGCTNGQILAEFNMVDNCGWEQFLAVFQAQTDIYYIYLEFNKGLSPTKDGSILIDDFSLDFTTPLPTQMLSIPYGADTTIQSTFTGSLFNWDINELQLSDDSSSQIINVITNYEVQLNYWTEDSCLIFENWLIYVNPIIPNGFTPLNQDNINDEFIITPLVEKAWLTVINRWGETIYENTNYQNDWSPTGIHSGVYYYSLYFETSNRYFSGFVTVF